MNKSITPPLVVIRDYIHISNGKVYGVYHGIYGKIRGHGKIRGQISTAYI